MTLVLGWIWSKFGLGISNRTRYKLHVCDKYLVECFFEHHDLFKNFDSRDDMILRFFFWRRAFEDIFKFLGCFCDVPFGHFDFFNLRRNVKMDK